MAKGRPPGHLCWLPAPPANQPETGSSEQAKMSEPGRKSATVEDASFSDRVYAWVRRIPRGQVINYGGIAALLGTPRAARGVGYALSHLPPGSDVPWWRVINRSGRISTSPLTGTAQIQRALLEQEGVEFDEAGHLSWERFGWDPHAGA